MRSRSSLVSLLFSVVALAGCASPVPSRLAWTPASEIQTLSASGATATSPGDQDIGIEAGGLLLIEARPGERVRVTGATKVEDLELGVATRDADPAAAITWLSSEPIAGGRTFLVPHWAPATTVVVRSRVAARLRAEVAEPEVDLLGWERFEEDAVEWTRGTRPSPPAAPSEAMAPSLRFLAAMRDALGSRAASSAGRAWLSLALVQEGMTERPITSLVFPWAPFAVTGGRAVASSGGAFDPPVRTVRRAVMAGADLEIAAPQADVLRLEIAGGVGPARVVLSAAGVPVRTIQLAGAARRSSPLRVRLLVPAGGAVRAHVELGEATIGVDAYQHRPSLAERLLLKWRDPSHLASLAAEDEVLGTLAAAARARDAESFRKLEEAAARAPDRGTEAVLRTLATAIAPTVTLAARAARAGFHAAETLRPATAWPLRRRIVEALLDRRPAMATAFPEGPGLVAPTGVDASVEEDAVAVRVALAILDPKTGPIRPEAADMASRFALRDTGRDDWASLARLAWQTEVGWRPLAVTGAPEAIVTWTAPVPEIGAPDGLCETTAGGAPRWTRLVPGVRELPVTVPSGATHAVVPIRGETRQPLAPGAFHVDATAVPVHGAIDVPSVVAVAAGAHAWTLAAGAPPVLVRVPREGAAPCAELRRMDRWFLAPREVTVEVPPGPVETIVRVTMRRAGPGPDGTTNPDGGEDGSPRRAGTGAEAPLHLDIGGIRAEVRRLGDEPVDVEAPIRVTGGPVVITPSAPVWLRVEVRARAAKGTPLPLALPSAPDEATLIAAVRAATKVIAAAPDDGGRSTGRKSRAGALASLGFRRLAVIDVGKGDAPSGDGSGGRDAEPADDVLARVLPAGAPAVVPLGVAALIEELPAPLASAGLTKVMERLAAGDAAGAAERFADVPEPARPDESTLLRAIVAERAQAWEPASRAYGRLAIESDRHAAAARAALAYADLALEKSAPDLALTGYLFAKRAQQHGADARAAMGRLDPAVGFVRPDTAAAAGHTWVERDGQDPRLAASLVERVRRAYLDAPDDAIVLDGDERIVLRIAPIVKAQLVIDHGCALLDVAPPASARCSAIVQIDGQPVACEGPGRSCTASVPKGKHRVEVALEAPVERMGWVRVRWTDAEPLRPPKVARWLETAEPLRPRSAARWLETDAARPLAMSFAGPTLVRIDARGTPGQSERLDVRIDGVSTASLELDAPADVAAFRRDLGDPLDRAVRGPQQIEVVVMAAGAHTLEVRSAGRALVSPSFAVARGLPRPVVTPAGTPLLPVGGAPIAPLPPPAPIVGEDTPPGPFTLSAQATLVLDKVTDPSLPADDAGRYVETSLAVRRRFLDGLVFTRLGALARVRTGLPTFGADARIDFDTPVGSPVPKAFLEGTVYGQQNASTFDAAGGVHAGVWWQFEPLPAVSVVPTLGVDLSTASLVDVARYEDLARIDPDVFARYDAPRPVELFATFLGSYRATMDLIVRLRLGTHVAGFEGVDDVFVYPSIDVAPGRGLAPTFSLGYALSYHFASASLSEPYVRHRVDLSAFFWQWVRASHRVSASASALVQQGSPFGDEVDVRLLFGLAYDFTAGRGVSDFSPLEMTFRERFDETGGRVIRRTPRTSEPPPEPPAAP